MLLDFLIPAIAVLITELGDKSQIAILTLSAKFKDHKKVFFGVMLAFLIADGMAVAFGNFIVDLIPATTMRGISGIVFIIFGLLAIASTREKKIRTPISSAFISSFALVFFSEMGDKTQIASAIFSTQYNSYLVLIGIMSSLALLSLVTLFIGKNLMRYFEKELLHYISGLVFIALGLFILLL